MCPTGSAFQDALRLYFTTLAVEDEALRVLNTRPWAEEELIEGDGFHPFDIQLIGLPDKNVRVLARIHQGGEVLHLAHVAYPLERLIPLTLHHAQGHTGPIAFLFLRDRRRGFSTCLGPLNYLSVLRGFHRRRRNYCHPSADNVVEFG
jgi:hypothetical protein